LHDEFLPLRLLTFCFFRGKTRIYKTYNETYFGHWNGRAGTNITKCLLRASENFKRATARFNMSLIIGPESGDNVRTNRMDDENGKPSIPKLSRRPLENISAKVGHYRRTQARAVFHPAHAPRTTRRRRRRRRRRRCQFHL
jgi:hypothetical protein